MTGKYKLSLGNLIRVVHDDKTGMTPEVKKAIDKEGVIVDAFTRQYKKYYMILLEDGKLYKIREEHLKWVGIKPDRGTYAGWLDQANKIKASKMKKPYCKMQEGRYMKKLREFGYTSANERTCAINLSKFIMTANVTEVKIIGFNKVLGAVAGDMQIDAAMQGIGLDPGNLPIIRSVSTVADNFDVRMTVRYTVFIPYTATDGVTHLISASYIGIDALYLALTGMAFMQRAKEAHVIVKDVELSGLLSI